MGTIREVFILEDQFTAQLTRYIKLGEQAAGVSKDMQASLLNIETATAATATAVDRLTNQLSEMSTSARKAASSTDILMGKIKSLVATYAGLQGIKTLVNLSDTMTQTTARLDMMNDGLQTTDQLNQMIYQSAQRSRGSYQATADMVAKLGTLAGDAFNNNTSDIVAFAEQINKQITLSGASAQAADAAILQLTQAMSSGVLRGEELNSILEQTPTIAQAIADYMGVSTGVMREMASEGAVTAEVVKNAMFQAAADTNAKFEQMPMTWGQVWTSFQNTAIMAMQPILKVINVVANNMETVAPIVAGAAAALGIYAAATAVSTAVTWLQVAANRALVASMLTNPIMWIAVAIGVVIGLIYKWVQATGGLQIAWLTVVDNVLYAWDNLELGFMTGVYAVQDWLDNLSLAWRSTGVAVQNWMGDMKVGALTILQDMINGAINLLNQFSGKINTIFGTSFDPIEQVTFAATAAAENEAAKQARTQELAAATQAAQQAAADRANTIANMTAEMNANHFARQQEILQKKVAQAEGTSSETPFVNPYSPDSGIADNIASIADSVGSIEKSVSMSNEDLKMLIDNAERRYVNNVNLTSQTPVINITGANTGNTAADRKAIADAVQTVLLEQLSSTSVRATAIPT